MNGLLIQWGDVPSSPKAGTCPLHVAYSNTNYKIFLGMASGGSFNDKTATNCAPSTKSDFHYDWRVGTSDGGNGPGYYFAIGY